MIRFVRVIALAVWEIGLLFFAFWFFLGATYNDAVGAALFVSLSRDVAAAIGGKP